MTAPNHVVSGLAIFVSISTVACGGPDGATAYAENGPEARAAWNAGLLDPDNLPAVFDQTALHHLRVLQLPPLLEGVN